MELHRRRKTITETECRYFVKQLVMVGGQSLSHSSRTPLASAISPNPSFPGLQLPSQQQHYSPRSETRKSVSQRRHAFENWRFRSRNTGGFQRRTKEVGNHPNQNTLFIRSAMFKRPSNPQTYFIECYITRPQLNISLLPLPKGLCVVRRTTLLRRF